MIQAIISTVGTSLLGNVARLSKDNKVRQLYDAKNWPQFAKEVALLEPGDPICGAEINSVSQLLTRKNFETVSTLHFCVSDTDEGRLLGSVLDKYYSERHPNLRVTIHSISDLSSINPERFRVYGLRNLARTVGRLVRDGGDPRYTALNCTGGYKAQVAIAVLIGQALDVPVYYKHEAFSAIISFPPMPVSFDYSLLAEHGDLLIALESGEVFESPVEVVEPIRALLEEVEGEGKHLWALAPIGQIYLEGFRQRYPLEQTLPPNVPDSERKPPTFGNDHHVPKGFVDYVNRVWQQTPYIQTCHTVSYAGQSAIRHRHFKVKPDHTIIGEYVGDFGARFEILTRASNDAQRQAVIIDLSQRFGQ
jgi:putative CRISPR-associated protein (TIGR02619 family)